MTLKIVGVYFKRSGQWARVSLYLFSCDTSSIVAHVIIYFIPLNKIGLKFSDEENPRIDVDITGKLQHLQFSACHFLAPNGAQYPVISLTH